MIVILSLFLWGSINNISYNLVLEEEKGVGLRLKGKDTVDMDVPVCYSSKKNSTYKMLCRIKIRVLILLSSPTN